MKTTCTLKNHTPLGGLAGRSIRMLGHRYQDPALTPSHRSTSVGNVWGKKWAGNNSSFHTPRPFWGVYPDLIYISCSPPSSGTSTPPLGRSRTLPYSRLLAHPSHFKNTPVLRASPGATPSSPFTLVNRVSYGLSVSDWKTSKN